MEKFDEMLKAAKPKYEPNDDFVQNVMSEISKLPIKRNHKRGLSLLSAAAVVGLLFGGVSVIFFAQSKSQDQVLSQGTNTQNETPGSSSSPTASSTHASVKPTSSPVGESSKISVEIQAAIALIDSELLASDSALNSLTLDELEQ